MTTEKIKFVEAAERIIAAFGEVVISFQRYDQEEGDGRQGFYVTESMDSVKKEIEKDWDWVEVFPHIGKHRKHFEKYREILDRS